MKADTRPLVRCRYCGQAVLAIDANGSRPDKHAIVGRVRKDGAVYRACKGGGR